MVGCYLATRDAPTLESGVTTINHRPGGVELLVAGYFNTDFKTPDGNKRDKEITAETATDGQENRIEHFIPCKILCTWEGWTWSMFRSDQEVRSWTDYILELDHSIFQNVAIQDPRQNTNYYMVLVCLHGVNLR